MTTLKARGATQVLMFLVLATSCSHRFGRSTTPPALGAQGGRYTLTDYTADETAYDTAVGSSPADAKKARRLREKMAYGILGEIDLEFGEFVNRFHIGRGNAKIGADAAQLGLAAATTLGQGARTKNILSAILTATTGARLSVDKNYFREKSTEAIIAQMDATRNRVRTIIVKRLSDDAYTWYAARSDVIEYFFAGTLQRGLQGIHMAAATEVRQSRDDLEEAMLTIPPTPKDMENAAAVAVSIDADLAVGGAKVRQFLKAMGVEMGEQATTQELRAAYRTLSFTTFADADQRAKFFAETAKAGLITQPTSN